MLFSTVVPRASSLLLLLVTVVSCRAGSMDDEHDNRHVRAHQRMPPLPRGGGQPRDGLRSDIFDDVQQNHDQQRQQDLDAMGSFCTFSAEESKAIGDVMFAPRGAIYPNFINYGAGTIIPELQSFADAVRAFDEQEISASSIRDEDIINMAMRPVNINRGGRKLQHNEQRRRRDQSSSIFDNNGDWQLLLQGCDTDILVEHVTGIMAECFDMSFFLAGVYDNNGPSLQGIGKTVGQTVSQDLLQGSESARIIVNIRSTLQRRSTSSTLAIGEICSMAIEEVGMNGILEAMARVPNVSAWHLAVAGLSFTPHLVALSLAEGRVMANKIAKVGDGESDVFAKAVNALVGMFGSLDALVGYTDGASMCSPVPTPVPLPTSGPSVTPPTLGPTQSNEPSITPPTLGPTQPTDPAGRGRTAGIFGDPHIVTFDGIEYDCQAEGEFVLVTSLETPEFMIQARFESVESPQCPGASIVTGIVIAEPDLPSVQVSMPVGGRDTTESFDIFVGGPNSEACPVDLFVNGTRVARNGATGSDAVQVSEISSGVRVFFPTTGVQILCLLRITESFGCHMTARVFLPFDYRSNEKLLGLLGTPNDNAADEWSKPDGSVFGTAKINAGLSSFPSWFEYCTTEWCVDQEASSIFTYNADESFDAFNGCNATYSEIMVVNIQSAIINSAVGDCNETDVMCLVDGVCGDFADARAFLQERSVLVEAREESNPQSMAPTVGPTSWAPSSVAPTTVPSSVGPVSVGPTSVAPTSVAPTSVAPTSVAPSMLPSAVTAAPVSPTSVAPTSLAPITVVPSTLPSFLSPTSAPTSSPTSNPTSSPTVGPSSVGPTSVAPSTMIPTMLQTTAPASAGPISIAPATTAPVTMAPASAGPISIAPATAVPVTMAPASAAPISAAPATTVPATMAPASAAPASVAPVTTAPASAGPTTTAPVSAAPVSTAPATTAASAGPISAAPATTAPATASPGPATTAPATTAPASSGPTSTAPATTAPATVAPTSTAPISTAPATTAPASAGPTSTAPVSTTPATSAPATVAPASAGPTSTAPTIPQMPTNDGPTSGPTFPTDRTGQGRTAGMFGDPHLSTFDRLEYDCQAAGEFVLLTSLETPEFMIQARFESVDSQDCPGASIITGIAIAEPGIPKIQVSMPVKGRSGSGSTGLFIGGPNNAFCSVDVFVDGAQVSLVDGTDLDSVRVSPIGKGAWIFFPGTGVQIHCYLRVSDSFGCHMTARVFLPFGYRSSERLIGLLGTPNDDPADDWTRSDGSTYPYDPTIVINPFSTFPNWYEYCTTEWCVDQAADSLFTYKTDESFETFNRCNDTYSEDLVLSIQSAILESDPAFELCGAGDLMCMVDGVCGDAADAEAFLQEKQQLAQVQDESALQTDG